jgi:hypothetical protein
MSAAAATGAQRVLVSGRIASTPFQGGAAWAVLQYLLGMRALGHEVWFVEELADDAILPAGSVLPMSTNAAYCERVLSGHGFDGRWSLLATDGGVSAGLDYDTLLRTKWDVHINLSGCLRQPELTDGVAVRIYVDLDPVFTQIWQLVDGHDLGLDGHTHFATVGSGLGTGGCPVPVGKMEWHHMLPPVVLSEWATDATPTIAAMTTVANWRSYGSVMWDGEILGQRAHSFRSFVGLPALTAVRLAPALAIDAGETEDLAALRRAGWDLIDPAEVASTPGDYRRFVRASTGELCIAKSGYVRSRSGWFSDRSACYLAAGRPVVAQDTGFGSALPVGDGLLSFDTPREAADALDRVAAEPERHAAAARKLAVGFLDSDKVLNGLLDYAGAGSA